MWFNEFKQRVTNNGGTPMTPLLGLLGGMSAGCFSTLGNNPFDVVKTKMQGTQASQYKNTWDCLSTIVRTEGVAALDSTSLGRVVREGVQFVNQRCGRGLQRRDDRSPRGGAHWLTPKVEKASFLFPLGSQTVWMAWYLGVRFALQQDRCRFMVWE